MGVIRDLCHKYTVLTEDEISTIEALAPFLQTIADLTDADIFIDCPCRNADSIVVAEAKPSGVPSSYQKSVVGLLAKAENEPAVARTSRLGVSTKQMKAVTQEDRRTIQSVEPIRNGEHIIGVLIQERHIDEKFFKNQRIRSAQRSYEAISGAFTRVMPENNWLTECIDEALLIVDDAGIITFRNTLAKELYQKLGYIDDVLGQPYDNVFLVNTDPAGEGSRMEVEVGRYVLDVKYIPLGAPNMAFVLIIRDLTWRREQEKALILKSVAVKEMHHRVKNNLQTIASLLRLQTRRTGSQETRQVLEESMNRSIAIASTHELLAQSGMDEIMLSEVIRNIKSNVLRYCAEPHTKVAVVLEGDDFSVDSDVGTSVALIVSELLHNAMKYAFAPGSTGVVRIVMTKGELYSRIQVIDDGQGFNVQDASKPRLGLSIVQTLVEDKLFGSLEIESGSSGTQVTFDFKNRITIAGDVT